MGKQNELGLSALPTSARAATVAAQIADAKRYAEDASGRLAVKVTSTGGNIDHRQARGRRVRQ
jgi:hypothetical protein